MKISLKPNKDFDRYLDQLSALGRDALDIIDKAVYDGAKVVADPVKEAIRNLPLDQMKKLDQRKGINRIQKEGLIESYGIAPLRDDGGFRNVKIGFDGYNNFITFKWPHGQPNAMIARSVESGTSFMPKNPIISRTTRQYKNACEQKMQNTIEKEIKKIF